MNTNFKHDQKANLSGVFGGVIGSTASSMIDHQDDTLLSRARALKAV